jgi:hypothetical protein
MKFPAMNDKIDEWRERGKCRGLLCGNYVTNHKIKAIKYFYQYNDNQSPEV